MRIRHLNKEKDAILSYLRAKGDENFQLWLGVAKLQAELEQERAATSQVQADDAEQEQNSQDQKVDQTAEDVVVGSGEVEQAAKAQAPGNVEDAA
ncbi:hypothetical protein U1Q18_039998 [Sarracenia purpurea var. burkii]